MNILLVDDEVVTINILKKRIDWEAIGINKVFSAFNTSEARRIITQNNIDLLICDIEMPHENGLQLIQWVQKQYPHIINIILTGYADFSYAQSAISIGVYKFLLKPVVFEDLMIIVQEAVEKLKKEKLKEKYRKYGEYLSIQFDSKESMEKWIDTTVERFNELVPDSTEEQSAVFIVKKFLEQHYNENISRKDIESIIHLNQDYLNREFKKMTGYSLLEYIQYYRIIVSKRKLISTNDSISEISLQIGYDSPAYFSKVFKKYEGITPLEYRNNSRIK